MRHVLGADTNLALSLIVAKTVSDGSIMVRRVDIPVKRPCNIPKITQFLRITDICLIYGHLTDLWTVGGDVHA